jgi:hypothetical protein
MKRNTAFGWVTAGAAGGLVAAIAAGCASSSTPPPKSDDKAKLAAAEAELDKVLFEQQLAMVRRFMSESDAAMKKGDYLTGAERLGQAALAYPKAYAQVAGPKDWHYRDVQQKFLEAVKRIPLPAPAPVGKGGEAPRVVEVIRTVEAPPDPVDQAGSRNCVARGDAAARKGDYRGALREYLGALRYPKARLPSDLADKCDSMIGKLQEPTPATPAGPTTINVAQPPGSADARRAQAEKLRPHAQRLAESVNVEDMKKARATYTALMSTGYYTTDDLKRLHELQVKLDRATVKTIFDD